MPNLSRFLESRSHSLKYLAVALGLARSGIAADVSASTPQAIHLITQHPGTPWNQPTPTISDRYYDQSYLDIASPEISHVCPGQARELGK